jgi:hypothetical protein
VVSKDSGSALTTRRLAPSLFAANVVASRVFMAIHYISSKKCQAKIMIRTVASAEGEVHKYANFVRHEVGA